MPKPPTPSLRQSARIREFRGEAVDPKQNEQYIELAMRELLFGDGPLPSPYPTAQIGEWVKGVAWRWPDEGCQMTEADYSTVTASTVVSIEWGGAWMDAWMCVAAERTHRRIHMHPALANGCAVRIGIGIERPPASPPLYMYVPHNLHLTDDHFN
jgi:hypothetical protein